ncbi:RTA1 domain protein [Cordyceps fumosorosea ARSEF 2679]|uniref:RTA1 domain protein n=1 Tax=Cordyceps fumosorosea (strain ARSEF 2679) TaxID=1081104 RepID=A0A168BLT0_CORFA|nr:RTA1 domain protein [Cordyceps fumosorosea ARSEF 2679]OAA70285.1 RTA1 domain protein [Cordyceps fumosorosea ARSEF 2679]
MANDDSSIWVYSPSFPLAIVGCVVYCLLFIAITYTTWIKHRAWFFSTVVVGAAVEVAGYVFRVYSTKHQTVLVPYILTLTFTVLAPVFVAAGNYLLISRLILSVLPPTRHRILGIAGRLLTPIFVTFDVVSFLVQGNGSAIASSGNWTGDKEKIGRYTLIGGLVLQLVAFGLFLAVFGRFHFLANKFAVPEAPVGWRKVARAVYISSIAIMIRCIYRVCEFAEGMQGYAFRTEWLFWAFESIPMVFAIGAFCVWHPSQYLPRSALLSSKARAKKQNSVEMATSTSTSHEAIV